METLAQAWPATLDFLETGGWVLYAIAGVTFAMWTLILERYWYMWFLHPKRAQAAEAAWQARSERKSWHAHQIRQRLISEVSLEASRNVTVIKTLVAVCPLFGLLGTVTGMIEVFDVMAVSGGGNARAMASGVSRATIPTMAGMVASLSGFIFGVSLDRAAHHESEKLAEHLAFEADGDTE